MTEIHPMTNPIRNYAWGSRTALAHMQDRTPAPEPEAELWIGAHPSASSLIHFGGNRTPPVTLHEAIAEDPPRFLGEGPDRPETLPFLLKILAIEKPLSIQVHPDEQQAAEGFARENSAGIRLDDPARNYKDPYAKPEVVVALTRMRILTGERPREELRHLARRLGLEWLTELVASGESSVLRAVLSMPLEAVGQAVAVTTEAAETASSTDQLTADAVDLLRSLTAAYPQDPGLLVALCMNLVELNPGEAMATPAGQLHAYVSGTAVEIMDASDNVLRAGLTSKHVDVVELLRITAVHQKQPVRAVLEPRPDGGVKIPLWSQTVRLARFQLDHEQPVELRGLSVLLCTSGTVGIAVPAGQLRINAGYSALHIGAARATVSGPGQLFIASWAGQ